MTDPIRPAVAGFQPERVDDPTLINLHDYEQAAAARLSPEALAYFSGGANDERTLTDNRAAFGRRRLVPRVLRDVSTVDTSVEVLGRRWPWPLFLCPTAFHRMAHPDGELGTARAAASRGITMTLSTSSSTDLAEVAQVDGPRWFQVYLLADPGARRAHGRARDRLRLRGAGPHRGPAPHRPPRAGHPRTASPSRAMSTFRTRPSPPDFPRPRALTVPFVDRITWDDLDWLAGFGRPVVVKGILHPDDATLALEHGAAAIQVSNHGGRQLDAAIASLDALPAVAEAVAGRVPVLMDGGVRRGTDVVIALALGATAVGIGRPALWGLAVGGEAGVGRVLDLLTAEIELAMALAGAASTADLPPDLVVPA